MYCCWSWVHCCFYKTNVFCVGLQNPILGIGITGYLSLVVRDLYPSPVLCSSLYAVLRSPSIVCIFSFWYFLFFLWHTLSALRLHMLLFSPMYFFCASFHLSIAILHTSSTTLFIFPSRVWVAVLKVSDFSLSQCSLMFIVFDFVATSLFFDRFAGLQPVFVRKLNYDLN